MVWDGVSRRVEIFVWWLAYIFGEVSVKVMVSCLTNGYGGNTGYSTSGFCEFLLLSR